MYISCWSLWQAGITKEKVSCCGSCHDDAEMFPGSYDLLEIYEEEIGLPRTKPYGEVVGTVCCTVSHFMESTGRKAELYRQVYEAAQPPVEQSQPDPKAHA